MRPVFADPKVDLVFKRIFGNKAHKRVLIQLLNDLLGLPDDRRIIEVEYLSPEQVPPLPRRKNSIVDVKCTDQRSTHYVVEMQVLHVEAFEKRLVYNGCKAYAGQLARGDLYPQLDDVVMVAICDFLLWHEEEKLPDAIQVPLVSRWRLTEEQTGARRLSQVRYVVMELPKYQGGAQPGSMIERWAYFFREAERLQEVPAELSEGSLREALEVARTASFTEAEWEEYDREKVAEQDARGALKMAQREGYDVGRDAGLKEGRDAGLKEGLEKGLRQAIVDLCEILAIELNAEQEAQIARLDGPALSRLREHLKQSRAWPG